MSRYDLTDFEWRVIEPLLPNKPRGVPRVDDRRVLNGIFWVLRSGAPWRDLPERYGPRTTCYNRFVRWRKAGVWDRLMDAISGPKSDGIYIVEFKTAAGEALAISVPSGETMADCDAGGGSSGTDARPNGVRNVPRASAHRPRRAAWRRSG
jgi:hypothetical protein